MTVRAFVLTLILAAACGTPAAGLPGQNPGEPVAVATGAQAPQPAPPGGRAQRGAAAPAAPAAPARATGDDAPPPPPPPPPPNPAAQRPGQPVNVKIEMLITDQRSNAAPVTRTLSLVVADGQRGMVRSSADVVGVGIGLPLNVDTVPTLIAGGKVRLYFTLQYDTPTPMDPGGPPARGAVVKTSINESVSLVLEDGKPVVAAQSADPISDRKVSVEVKATILR